MVRIRTVVALVLALAGTAAAAQRNPPSPCVTHILFIGNSYTFFNNMPAIVAQLAEAAHECKVDARMVAPGGVGLKDHWEKGEARPALREKSWDFVVLQAESTLGIDYFLDGNPRVTSDEVFFPIAKKWATEISHHGAKPVFFLPWAHKATPDDQAALNYAYMRAARKAGAIVAPIGLAWSEVRVQDQSIDLYYKDGSHPSPAGSYLAACAIYAAIFQRSPVGLPAHITGIPIEASGKIGQDKSAVLVDLPSEQAQTLQAAAWSAWQLLQKNGGYVDVHPVSPPVPTFAPDGPLSSANLAGTWSGQLLFYPGTGAVEMILSLRREGHSWKGHLNINYPVKELAAESFDLTDLQVDERELTFSAPHSAGVNNLRVVFRGGRTGADLHGTAQAGFKPFDAPSITVLGTWTLHRQNP